MSTGATNGRLPVLLYLLVFVNSLRAETTWADLGDLTSSRNGLAAGLIETSNDLFVIGGSGEHGPINLLQVAPADLPSPQWKSLPSMPTPRSGLSAVFFPPTNEVVAIGGLDANGDVLDKVEIFSLATNTWRTGAPIPTGRQLFSAVVVGSKIFALGGWNPLIGSLKSVQVYSPIEDEWQLVRDMLYPTTAPSAVVVDGEIFVMGGYQYGQPSFSDRVQKLANNTNRWTVVSPMPEPRAFFAATTREKIIYAIGGQNGAVMSSVHTYNVTADQWSVTFPSLQTPREALAAVGVRNRIDAMGGRDGNLLQSIETVSLISSVQAL